MGPKKKDKKRKGSGGKGKQTPQIDSRQLLSRVWALAEPLCEHEGVELVHVEYQGESQGRILRLYIDRSPGVTLEDCTNISRQLGDVLDVELDDIGPYNLEVSSPGLDRPLSREKDFERFKGEVITLRTTHSFDGKKNFKGILSGMSLGIVKLMIEDKTVGIPYPEICKARLIYPLDDMNRSDEDL